MLIMSPALENPRMYEFMKMMMIMPFLGGLMNMVGAPTAITAALG